MADGLAWQIRSTGSVDYWALPAFETKGFFAAFTLRTNEGNQGAQPGFNLRNHGEDSPEGVACNRRRWQQALPEGVSQQIQLVRQVHGVNTLIVREPMGHRRDDWWLGPIADGMLSTSDDVLLGMLFADCLPVFIVDPENGALALLHAGWRGLIKGIIGTGLKRLQRKYGTRPDRCWVALGPCIERDAYQVDQPVLAALVRNFPDWREVVYPSNHGRVRLDLAAGARSRLETAGVLPTAIIAPPTGTYFDTRHYSFRRGNQLERCGAFLGRMRQEPDGTADQSELEERSS